MKRLAVLIFLLFFSQSFSQNEELDSLTIKLAYQNPDSSKVDTSVNIIKLLFEAGDYKKAQQFIALSEDLAKDLNYKKGLAQIAFYKAKIYSDTNNPVLAIKQFKQSKSLYTSIKDTVEVARINSNLGILEIKNGNYKQGLN